MVWNKLYIEDVKNYVIQNSDVKLLSETYEHAKGKLTFLCICGNEYITTLDSFKRNKQYRCKECSKKEKIRKLTKTNEWFLAKLKSKTGDEYKPLSNYKNIDKKITAMHTVCGFEYEVTPSNLLRGRKCPKCMKRVKTKDTDYVKKEITEMVGNEYSLLSEYKASRLKVTIKHNKCGKEYETTMNDFQQGKRCPRCRESKGEKRISAFLIENKIVHVAQYSFNNLKGSSGRKLKFDFALLDESNHPKILIEYDGEFHYEEKTALRSKKQFINQKENDSLKDLYCKENNIRLVRIPYWEKDNIEKILEVAIK